MNTLKINGRTYYCTHVQSVGRTQRPGEYQVWSARCERPYYVEGGKRAGGTSRDWFLEGPGIGTHIKCTSLLDAVKLIESGL